MNNNRRIFLGKSLVSVFGILPVAYQSGWSNTTYPGIATPQNFQTGEEPDPLFPTQDPLVVREVVGAAHANFDKLKGLVTDRPELAKANFDWGFGDWESALGAASHMGRKDIAAFLIGHGARPTIFTFAMLGKLEAVKNMIEAMPGIQKVPGPHGITLLSHAQMRLRRKNVEDSEREEQEALVAYLEALGDADVKATALDITPEEQKVYLGKYVFGEAEDAFFKVTINKRGVLFMGRGNYFGRTLLRTGTHSFAPGGAPSVQIKFEVKDGLAQSVTVHDPMPIVKGVRVEEE